LPPLAACAACLSVYALGLSVPVAEPACEACDGARRDLSEFRARREVREPVLVELSPVVVARRVAKAAPSAALVAIDPLGCILVERDARALLELAAADVGQPCGLRAPRLLKACGTIPALLALTR